MAVDLAQVIPPLVRAKVDFILIGGMAAILHYSRTHDNIERLTTALARITPTFATRHRVCRLHGILKQFATA